MSIFLKPPPLLYLAPCQYFFLEDHIFLSNKHGFLFGSCRAKQKDILCFETKRGQRVRNAIKEVQYLDWEWFCLSSQTWQMFLQNPLFNTFNTQCCNNYISKDWKHFVEHIGIKSVEDPGKGRSGQKWLFNVTSKEICFLFTFTARNKIQNIHQKSRNSWIPMLVNDKKQTIVNFSHIYIHFVALYGLVKNVT